jgi:hypothetical protein
MKKKSMPGALALLLAATWLAGCATNSLQYDLGVRAVNLPGADHSGKSLVLGQAHMRGYGDWVVIFVTAVDQEKTFSQMQLRPSINLQVPAGKHTLKVKAMFGNFAHSQESDEPSIDVDLRAGQAYQLQAREVTNIRGQAGVELWLEHLGAIAQYEAYRKAHPDSKGEPVSRGALSAQ